MLAVWAVLLKFEVWAGFGMFCACWNTLSSWFLGLCRVVVGWMFECTVNGVSEQSLPGSPPTENLCATRLAK